MTNSIRIPNTTVVWTDDVPERYPAITIDPKHLDMGVIVRIWTGPDDEPIRLDLTVPQARRLHRGFTLAANATVASNVLG